MVHRLATRAFAASITVTALAGTLPASAAKADVMVYPGMEIRQDNRVCTLGYVDPGLKIAFTAGHCRGGGGVVTDRGGTVIGRMAAFRDNTPSGTTVSTSQVINDYEAIVLDNGVTANNILPGGRPLVSDPGLALTPGQPVCHFGVITGETCGTVESVNNGWFTMSHGVQSHNGDSGGPVYLAPSGGPGQIVGIFNSVWGEYPAAVSWQATSEEVREDLGVRDNAR
ncbi:Rv1815 family serine proteinase [Mycobacterium avium]|uniref:Rv1815 family serine proteinase n=1 Tax=Mycobacterium avium TaxID=1764 RepID=UPI0001B59E9E|nr:hypothetical protein [Mycobacterium avium]ETB09304.1 hypothetical protein P863_12625 [Mycobacterium avium subsp. silvaticum ATCC 49884]ETB16281.1 hypothetical protein O972_13160 [Mycobacterium avium subsp. avium 10-9275]ETB20798.1 hypothetical protein O973_12655 [Mycobacterium avium subsp. avium 11-4751]ANR93702.1 hypothetical protein BBJ32_21985 [Mycobacterium avium]AYJ04682.1 hypothetical protein DBO90_07590 [Mycobacterium avium]